MKKFNKFFIALMSAGILASCSSDNLDGPKTPGNGMGENVYLSLNIELPSAKGTRSQTEDDGTSDATPDTEPGKDYENSVKSVFIVLATTDNEYIASGEVINGKLSAISDNSYSSIASIEKTNISSFYTEGKTDFTINVFVFCNPTNHLMTEIKKSSYGSKDWIGLICSEEISAIANTTDGKFLMSNAKIATRELPNSLNDWDNYKTENSPFNLSGKNAEGKSNEVDNLSSRGPIEVIRTAARLDFKDGSTLGNNTYNVIFGKKDDGTQGDPFIKVQLQRMALTNMATKYYYLHRTSSDGKNTNSTLCGTETPTNYIVGPYWNTDLSTIKSDFTQYYNFPLFKKANDNSFVVDNNLQNEDRWGSSLISEVLKDEAENDQYNEKNDYKIWKYCTENVIPADENGQQYGRSTIIVFKAKILATDNALSADKTKYPWLQDVANCLNNTDKSLKGTPSEDPIIYQFAGSLYKTWNQGVREAVIHEAVKFGENNTFSVDRNNPLYVAVYGNGGMGSFTRDGITYTDDLEEAEGTANKAWNAWATGENAKNDETKLAAMRKAVTKAGFTIYQSSTDNKYGAGYYCYYYYANYHNNNNKPGVMGPMEFAVVRNNVYKLSVNSIKKLGHPRISDNDPDKPTPETPDESNDIYFSVTCKVKDWGVRINGIEF